jgi:hypothetical protein
MIAAKPSATSPTSSNSRSEKPPPKPWQQIWATVKSSTRRLFGLDDEGLQ